MMDDPDLEVDNERFDGGEENGDEGGEEGVTYKEIEIREQDRFLPIANIARIMKKVLPNNAKIAKESKESIQECVSEFISFITSEASDKCQQEKRKTINGDDLLWAMSTLGFDKYVDPLKIYLSKYRDSVKGERPEKKPSRKESAQAKSMIPQSFAPFDPPDIPPGMGFLADHGSPMMAPGKSETTPHQLSLSATPHLRPSSAAPGGESITKPQFMQSQHNLPPHQSRVQPQLQQHPTPQHQNMSDLHLS